MAGFAEKTHTDVSLWDALELREPMEGLAERRARLRRGLGRAAPYLIKK